MAQFQYATKTGGMNTIDAPDSNAALIALKGTQDADPQSGVSMVKAPIVPSTTPASATSLPTPSPALPSTPIPSTSTPSNTPTTPTTYNRIPATPSVDTAMAKYDETQTPITPETTYANELAKRKDEIAAINQKYDLGVQGEEEAGQVREGGLRAVMSGFGLGGSMTALGERSKNVQTTEKAKQLQNSLRATELGGLYAKIDESSKSLYEAQLKRNDEQAKIAKDNLVSAGESAISALASGLAEKGVSSFADAQKLDSQGELKKIQDALGYSDYQMHQIWNNSLPEQFKPISYEHYTPNTDGTTTRHLVTFDKSTGKQSETTQTINAPFNVVAGQDKNALKTKEGIPLIPQYGADGKTIISYAPAWSDKGEFKEIGTDQFGNKTFGFVNAQTGAITPANPPATSSDSTSPTQTSNGGINIFGIKATSTTAGLGGVDSGVKSSDGGTFLSSQGEAKDTEIAKNLLTSDIYKNLSVDEALKKWSNNGYGADAVPGIDKNAKIGSLSDSQINQVLQGIKTREGVSTTPIAPTNAVNSQYDAIFKENPNLNRDAFNKLPNDMVRTDVLSLINGEALISDIAKGMGGAKKAEAYNAYAKQIDPTYSEAQNKQRYNFQNKWNTDRQYYQTRVSINTALSHMARLSELSKELQNTDISKYNSVANFVAENINKPGIADAVAQFQDTVNLLGVEIARAYKGGVPDTAEIKQQQDSLNSSRPDNIVQSVLNNKSYLMSSAMKSMSEEYKKVMGKYPDEALINSNILDEFKAKGLDVSNLLKNFPDGSTFEYGGQMVRKNGNDDYEIIK